MLNDNLLSDRLNSFREGKTEEQLEKEFLENIDYEDPPWVSLLYKSLDLLTIVLRIFAYGYAAKAIFSTDWKFWSVLAIGVSTDVILSNIFEIFKK